MLLFDPSVGQLADRYTILRIKIRKAVSAGAGTDAIKQECITCSDVIIDRLAASSSEQQEKFLALEKDLFRRNERQWELEDAVRAAIKALPEKPSYEELLNVTNIARENCSGNEHRAQLVREIDTIFGVAPEFKAYK